MHIMELDTSTIEDLGRFFTIEIRLFLQVLEKSDEKTQLFAKCNIESSNINSVELKTFTKVEFSH